MHDQPRYKPYGASPFFADGTSARPLIEGTVPRGYLREDKQFYTGKVRGPDRAGPGAASARGLGSLSEQAGAVSQAGSRTAVVPLAPSLGAAPAGVAGQPGTEQVGLATRALAAVRSGAAAEADATTFPFPVTAEVLKRGQERYNIFCSVCHGLTGSGDGMIVRRGFRAPPSYHTDALRGAAVGHFFDVVTNGFGAMSSYAAQIPPADRWAIIAYIRALQLSQHQPGLAPAGSNQPGTRAGTGGRER